MRVPKIGYVLAAGKGTRTGYLGGILPKTMIPVAGRPLLWYSIRTLVDLGVRDAVIVLHHSSRLASNYVDGINASDCGLSSIRSFVLRDETSGPVESLARAARLDKGPVAIALGDDITVGSSLPNLLRRYLDRSAKAAQLSVRERNLASLRRSCEMVIDSRGLILSIKEKPRQPRSSLRGCGVYIFDGEFLSPILEKALKNPQEIATLTDIMQLAVGCKSAVSVVLRGRNVNVNTVDDVLRAWTLVSASGRGL